MVHLSTYSGESYTFSIRTSRLVGVVSATNALMSEEEGIRPVRSSVILRMNSVSVDSGAAGTFDDTSPSRVMSSLKFRGGNDAALIVASSALTPGWTSFVNELA